VTAALHWLPDGARHGLQAYVDTLAARAGVVFGVELPGGRRFQGGDGKPGFTLVFRNDAAMLSTVTRGHMGLLESYFDQAVDIEGDIGAAFAAATSAGFDLQFRPWNTIENGLHEWRHSNATPAQAKVNASAHYGLGVEFYRRWLDDPLLMYTCGYWPAGTQSLEQAQQQKIDHVCRKIGLAAGERFVDIGCGFGGFMFRAQETTGAVGTGINTTTEQVEIGRAHV